MKKIKLSLTALALVAAIGGSLIGQTTQAKSALTNFDYKHVITGVQDLNVSRSQAQQDLGCPDENATLCAEAYVAGHVGDPSFRVPSEDIFKIQ